MEEKIYELKENNTNRFFHLSSFNKDDLEFEIYGLKNGLFVVFKTNATKRIITVKNTLECLEIDCKTNCLLYIKDNYKIIDRLQFITLIENLTENEIKRMNKKLFYI